MKPECWQQVDNIFQAVLQSEPEARGGLFFDEARADDAALRLEVETLRGFGPC